MKENYIKKLYADRLYADKAQKPLKPCDTPLGAVLDFSLEQPDAMPDIFVIDKLYQEASKWENRGYLNKCSKDFNNSVKTYLDNSFNTLKLDSNDEITATCGTTSALNMLAMSFINPADSVLITKPFVSPLYTMTKYLGGNVIYMPQTAKSFPKYEDIPQKSLKKAKLLYISYPNNPTGNTATAEFFKETIGFAKTNSLIVVHDAAYASLVYEEGRQLSFLSVDGAKKVGVELHSFSHGFNMAGWRIGFMAGNKNIVKAFNDVCLKTGMGQYTPIQRAAAFALAHTDIASKTAKRYERRMSMLCSTLDLLGFKVKMPNAGFYLFVKAPRQTETGVKFNTPYDFEEFLGARGIKVKAFDEGIRFSVTYSALGESEEQFVMNDFYDRLKEFVFIF